MTCIFLPYWEVDLFHICFLLPASAHPSARHWWCMALSLQKLKVSLQSSVQLYSLDQIDSMKENTKLTFSISVFYHHHLYIFLGTANTDIGIGILKYLISVRIFSILTQDYRRDRGVILTHVLCNCYFEHKCVLQNAWKTRHKIYNIAYLVTYRSVI